MIYDERRANFKFIRNKENKYRNNKQKNKQLITSKNLDFKK